jgi:Cys-tRNA(Pro) deacylase
LTEPRTPAHFQATLDSLGLDIRVQTFETSTATAETAAASVGTTLGSIVKSLCFLVDGKPVVVLTAGDQKVDDRKLGALYGVGRKKVKIASAEETIRVTGYAPGGVPPIGHATTLPIWIDQTLGRFETVYAAAGSPSSIFPIAFSKLVAVTGGQVADLTKAPDTQTPA